MVKGALRQDNGEEESIGEWVPKTYSAKFAIKNRALAAIPTVGDKVNIGSDGMPLDYWAAVAGAEDLEVGTVRVTADLDPGSQWEQLDLGEESEEYEVLSFHGDAVMIPEELVEEKRTPSSELEEK